MLARHQSDASRISDGLATFLARIPASTIPGTFFSPPVDRRHRRAMRPPSGAAEGAQAGLAAVALTARRRVDGLQLDLPMIRSADENETMKRNWNWTLWMGISFRDRWSRHLPILRPLCGYA